MTQSTLLILGGALATCVLAALVFGPGTSEDKRLRQERKLLRALEAQRRTYDARRRREERRQAAAVATPSPMQVEPVEAEAEQERRAALEAAEAERRAAERQRRREEKEQAAARKAERAERRSAERERKRREKEEAAARKAAERDVEDQRPEPEVEVERPLAELPLYSWASRIENEDSAPTDTD